MRNSFIEVFGAVMCVFVSNYTQGMDRFLSKYEKTNDKLEYSLEEKEAIASALENIPETDPKYPLEKKDIASALEDISETDPEYLLEKFYSLSENWKTQVIRENHPYRTEATITWINPEDSPYLDQGGTRFGINLEDSSNNFFLDALKSFSDIWCKYASKICELCPDVDESSPLPGTPYFLFPFHSSKDRKVSFAFKDGKIFAKEEGKGGAPKVSYMPGESPIKIQPPEPGLKPRQTFKTQLL